MFRLFFDSCLRYGRLIIRSLLPRGGGVAPLSLKRLAVMAMFLPVFGLLQACHWLGFLLDEIFFRRYNTIAVRQPLFIVGVPRSGTTFFHRVLAEDRQFTTFSTWECIFAPSITERKIWLALTALDARIGRPAERLTAWFVARCSSELDGIHKITLQAPEEDYLTLLPILRSFVLILPFPFAREVWEMGFFDRDIQGGQRSRILAFYKKCLQKHLYVHGEDKRLLSKNASFPPLVAGLNETFPDCRIICCMRDPMETTPSQLSAIRPGMALFGLGRDNPALRDRMLHVLAFYHDNLLDTLPGLPANRHVFVDMARFKTDLTDTVVGAYQRLGLTMSETFADRLAIEDHNAKRFKGAHHYDLAAFGLTRQAIEQRFQRAYAQYPFVRGDSGDPPAADDDIPQRLIPAAHGNRVQ